MKQLLVWGITLGLTSMSLSPRAYALWFSVPKKAKALLEFGRANGNELNPNEIDILVWNTYKSQNPSWQDDYNFLLKGRELAILQEAFLRPVVVDTFSNQDDYKYLMATSFIYTKSNIPTGTATGSSVNPKNFYFKKTRDVEILGLTPKATLFTEYALSGRTDTLLVINIHALNSVPAFIFKRHLDDAIVEIKKHRGPVVYAGDFNTWSWLKTKVLKKSMKKLGMEEVIFPNGGDRMRSGLTKRVIDFIFVRGMKYENAWVYGQLEGADHKALTARLKVK